MSGFSADWLTLREPYDLRSRNAIVLDAVAAHLEPNFSVQIVDLACGTGSTSRALGPHLPVRQNWRLIDNDLGLLARARVTPVAGDTAINVIPLDLNRDLEAALDGAVDLVATSALLDLVSEPWLDRLVVEIVARSIPLYAALSLRRAHEINATDPSMTREIATAVNAHQRTDRLRAGAGPQRPPSPSPLRKALRLFGGARHLDCDGTGRFRKSKPRYWPDGHTPRTTWARSRGPTQRRGLRAAAIPLPPDAAHYQSVMSTFSQCRAPHAELTGRSRTAHRRPSYAHARACEAPGRRGRAMAG